MKQEQFKNVYRQIRLTEKQKDMIWQCIEETSRPDAIPKKVFWPTRIAVCLVILLMSGMTVLAANDFSLTDKISEAMQLLTQNKELPTEDQKDLYAQYGQVLDSEIELDNGTLKLDAALYDQNQLLVPFRYIFHSDIEGYDELTTGTDIDQASSYGTLCKYNQDTDIFLSEFSFYIVQGSEQLNEKTGCYLITNPVIAEDGTISGTLLFFSQQSRSFEPGYVIQLVRMADSETAVQTAEETNEQIVYKLCAEFTLGKALEQQELAIDEENAAALQDMGISVERMSISPLSICYSGKGTHTGALSASVTVVLKDGSIIESSPNGGGFSLSDTNQDNTSFTFFASKVFATPVMIEDIAEIHIQDHQNADIHIPVE